MWWKDGARFECQQSGKCCVARGAYGYVLLTTEDRHRFAKHLKIPTQTFTKNYTRVINGYRYLNDSKKACRFLEGTKCSVYEARPTQCRTWPFWPENMGAKGWSKEIAAFCPGVGKGPLRPASEIEAALALDQQE